MITKIKLIEFLENIEENSNVLSLFAMNECEDDLGCYYYPFLNDNDYALMVSYRDDRFYITLVPNKDIMEETYLEEILEEKVFIIPLSNHFIVSHAEDRTPKERAARFVACCVNKSHLMTELVEEISNRLGEHNASGRTIVDYAEEGIYDFIVANLRNGNTELSVTADMLMNRNKTMQDYYRMLSGEQDDASIVKCYLYDVATYKALQRMHRQIKNDFGTVLCKIHDHDTSKELCQRWVNLESPNISTIDVTMLDE